MVYRYRYYNNKQKIYGVAAALANGFGLSSRYPHVIYEYSPYSNYPRVTDTFAFRLFRRINDSVFVVLDRKIIAFDTTLEYTPGWSMSRMEVVTPSGDTLGYNVMEAFFDQPHDMIGEEFWIGVFPVHSYRWGLCYLAPNGFNSGPPNYSEATSDSCFVPGDREFIFDCYNTFC